MKPDPEKDDLALMVDEFAAKLGEHCDSVRIFVTRPSPDDSTKTQSYEQGSGNFYAQFGQINEWLAMQRTYMAIEARRRDARAQEEQE